MDAFSFILSCSGLWFLWRVGKALAGFFASVSEAVEALSRSELTIIIHEADDSEPGQAQGK